MGTRHKQTVINKMGEKKIQQYGQWDGYPEGQGVDILNYLKNGNLKIYQDNLEKIPIITDEQIDAVESVDDWDKEYPYLSRDCGAKIHQMIENGDVMFVQHITDEFAKYWCVGFYTIDFKNNLFISEYRGKIVELKLTELPSEHEYIKMFNDQQN